MRYTSPVFTKQLCSDALQLTSVHRTTLFRCVTAHQCSPNNFVQMRYTSPVFTEQLCSDALQLTSVHRTTLFRCVTAHQCSPNNFVQMRYTSLMCNASCQFRVASIQGIHAFSTAVQAIMCINTFNRRCGKVFILFPR